MKLTVDSLSWQTEDSQTGKEERRKSDLDYIYLAHAEIRGYTVAKFVGALCDKQEGHGFDSRWCQCNFSSTQSFQKHYGPEVDSASDRNEYQEFPGG